MSRDEKTRTEYEVIGKHTVQVTYGDPRHYAKPTIIYAVVALDGRGMSEDRYRYATDMDNYCLISLGQADGSRWYPNIGHRWDEVFDYPSLESAVAAVLDRRELARLRKLAKLVDARAELQDKLRDLETQITAASKRLV